VEPEAVDDSVLVITEQDLGGRQLTSRRPHTDMPPAGFGSTHFTED